MKKPNLQINSEAIEAFTKMEEEGCVEEVKEEVKGPILPVVKVGMDLGASRIKFSFEKNGVIIDKAFENRYDIDRESYQNGNRVIFNKEDQIIGCLDGQSNRKELKINTKNLGHIVSLVIYHVQKELGIKELSLDLVSLLPFEQFEATVDTYEEMLLDLDGKSAVVTGDDGVDYPININIDGVTIGVEGAYLMNCLDMDQVVQTEEDVLLLDIGSSTTDALKVEKKNGVWTIVSAKSYDFGGGEICETIAHLLKKNDKIPVKAKDIERKQYFNWQGEKLTVSDYADYAEQYVKKFVGQFEQNDDIGLYKTVLSGGAGYIVKECTYFKENVPNNVCVSPLLSTFGNSRGALLA